MAQHLLFVFLAPIFFGICLICRPKNGASSVRLLTITNYILISTAESFQHVNVIEINPL